MKPLSIFVFALSFLAFRPCAAPQGSLIPPGAPAATMKSLDQVEARNIIDPRKAGFSLPYTISQPGSYYLAGNITAAANTNGIIISADNVTLDLNGFALIGGGGGSGTGITSNGQNARIVNGVIRGWASNGVAAINSTFEELRLWSNGGKGLAVGGGSRIKNCVAAGNGGYGFSLSDSGSIIDSVAYGNSGIGIVAGGGCLIKNCVATGNGGGGCSVSSSNSSVVDSVASNNSGIGINIDAAYGCTVVHCAVSGNTAQGIQGSGFIQSCLVSDNGSDGIYILEIDFYSTVRDCQVVGNAQNGILLGAYESSVLNNQCYDNGASGIWVSHHNNLVDGNICTSNKGYGVNVTGGRNMITRNSSRGNTLGPWNIQAGLGNAFGAIVDMSAGGAIPGTATAWTNFTY